MQTTVLSTLYTFQWRKRDFQFNNCLQETGRTPNFLCNMIKFNWSVRGYFIAFINGQKEWKWGLQSIPLLTCRLSGGELRGELDYRVAKTCQPCQPVGANFSRPVLIFGQKCSIMTNAHITCAIAH